MTRHLSLAIRFAPGVSRVGLDLDALLDRIAATLADLLGSPLLPASYRGNEIGVEYTWVIGPESRAPITPCGSFGWAVETTPGAPVRSVNWLKGGD
jgi:hypothetical protein